MCTVESPWLIPYHPLRARRCHSAAFRQRGSLGLRPLYEALESSQFESVAAGAFRAPPGTHPVPDRVASLVRFRQRSVVRVALEKGLCNPWNWRRGLASRLSHHGMAERTAVRGSAERRHVLRFPMHQPHQFPLVPLSDLLVVTPRRGRIHFLSCGIPTFGSSLLEATRNMISKFLYYC